VGPERAEPSMVLFSVSLLLRQLVAHRLRRALRSRLAIIIGLVLSMWLASATLFYYTEHVLGRRSDVDFAASLYWALITMATVGYGDIVPHRGPGWAVAAATAVMGIAVYTLAISVIADEFMEASLRRSLGMAPMKGKDIVVIGDTDACRDLVDELVKNGLGSRVGWLLGEKPSSEPPVDYLIGDPLRRDDLRKAGVPGARTVALCLGDDSRTLHVALAVRRLNRKARVVAAVESGEAEELLREAGVDHVVSTRLLGRTLASAVFEPWVAWFIEEAASVEGMADVGQAEVDASLAGLSVREAEERLAERLGGRVLVLGVVREGRPVLAPLREMRLEKGDVVVFLHVKQ
jgi:voltage-gated potassium channel